MSTRKLNIPVIVGTSRKGRASVHGARFICDLLNRRAGVISELIDIASVPLPTDDAGEAIKHPLFAAAMRDADGIVIVAPEYDHSFPGLLKHALDSCLSEHEEDQCSGNPLTPGLGIRSNSIVERFEPSQPLDKAVPSDERQRTNS